MKHQARCFLLAAMALLTGCASAYKPPTSAEPHALLKYRRVYEYLGGTSLQEGVAVQGHPAFQASANVAEVSGPRIDAILIHPRAALLRVASNFVHYETRWVQETYSQQVPYQDTESYSCGSSRCTRSVTRYRYESRHRTVQKQVAVTDGSCTQSTWIKPQANAVYLLELTMQDRQICHLSCFEQTKGSASGEFSNSPCPLPSSAERAAAEADD